MKCLVVNMSKTPRIALLLYLILFSFAEHSFADDQPDQILQETPAARKKSMSIEKITGEENRDTHSKKIDYAGVLQIQFANDVFFSSDDHFTNGFSLFWQPPLVNTWRDTYLPWILADLVSKLPIINSADTQKHVGFAFLQLMVTPENLLEPSIIQDDLPYTGFLGALIQLSSSNDHQFDVIQLTLGIVGPSSVAKQVQKEAHRLTDTDIPQGWRNQLGDEFIVNLDALHAKRIVNRPSGGIWGAGFDLDWRVSAGAGNFFTYAAVGLGFRFGWNIIPGWELAPIGNRAISNNFHDHSRSPKYSLYFYAILEGFGIARALFLDGNAWRDSHSVNRVPIQCKSSYGLVFKISSFIVRTSFIITTKVFSEQSSDFEQVGIVDFGFVF